MGNLAFYGNLWNTVFVQNALGICLLLNSVAVFGQTHTFPVTFNIFPVKMSQKWIQYCNNAVLHIFMFHVNTLFILIWEPLGWGGTMGVSHSRMPTISQSLSCNLEITLWECLPDWKAWRPRYLASCKLYYPEEAVNGKFVLETVDSVNVSFKKKNN